MISFSLLKLCNLHPIVQFVMQTQVAEYKQLKDTLNRIPSFRKPEQTEQQVPKHGSFFRSNCKPLSMAVVQGSHGEVVENETGKTSLEADHGES